MKQIKKFIWPLFFGFSVLLLSSTNAFGQTTITIEPGDNWTDVRLLTSSEPGKEHYFITNYANTIRIAANAWTASGYPFYTRGLIRFDLSAIPEGSIIQSAILYLYSEPTYSYNVNENSSLTGANTFYFEKVTSNWNETTVTWNNQPPSTVSDRIWYPASTSPNENIQVDIKPLVQSWVNDPAENYGMKMVLENELHYRSRSYASEDHPDPAIRPKLVINYEEPSHKVTWTDLRRNGSTRQYTQKDRGTWRWERRRLLGGGIARRNRWVGRDDDIGNRDNPLFWPFRMECQHPKQYDQLQHTDNQPYPQRLHL